MLAGLRAHRRVDLVVAILGEVDPTTRHALGALTGIGVIAVLTRPATLAPTSSLVVVDASTTPFATAWNQTLTRSFSARRPPSAWQAARA